MPVLLLIGIAIASLIVIFAATGCKDSPSSMKALKPGISTNRIDSMSREEIKGMLRRIEETPAPESKMGAMCYDISMYPSTTDYVCATCGEKTLYNNTHAMALYHLEQCRRSLPAARAAANLKLTLEEASFCKHCSPDIGSPSLGLTVTYDDGTAHTFAPVHETDLQILASFLSGKTSYATFNEGIDPLQEHLPRIRQLLGIQQPAAVEVDISD